MDISVQLLMILETVEETHPGLLMLLILHCLSHAACSTSDMYCYARTLWLADACDRRVRFFREFLGSCVSILAGFNYQAQASDRLVVRCRVSVSSFSALAA
jgi:hypothetical protein